MSNQQNIHGRRVVFKRQQYWLCKRLQLNIFENRKVCTNWVRRILLTDVAYDIIKTFRSNNDSFRQAKLESYIQWNLKKGSRHNTMLNFFKSKINSAFLFKSYAYDNIYHDQKLWIHLKKTKIFLDRERYSSLLNSTNVNNFRKYNIKKVLGKNILSSKLNDNYDFWYKGLEPEAGSFRVRSFITNSASWEISPTIDSYFNQFYFSKKSGKYRGYRHVIYSPGTIRDVLTYKLMLLQKKIYKRLIFRNNVIKILLKILFEPIKNIKKTLLHFLRSIKYKIYMRNRNAIIILVNLISFLKKNRINKAIKLYRSMNMYDYKYIMFFKKYNYYSDMHLIMKKSNKMAILKSYQKVWSSSLDTNWISSWFLPNSIRSTSHLIEKISNSYQCIQSRSRYEDYDIVYNVDIYRRCYNHVFYIKNMKEYKFFIKWYYLYLLRDKYYLYNPIIFGSLEYRRRLLLKSLFFFQNNNNYSKLSYCSLISYICSGSNINPSYYFKINMSRYMTSSNSYVYNLKLMNFKNMRASNNSFDYTYYFYSYNSYKKYIMNVASWFPNSKVAYTKLFSIFWELRLNAIIIKSSYDLHFTYYNKLLFIHDKYYLKYHIMSETNMLYYDSNVLSTMHINTNFSNNLYLSLNYNMLFFLINNYNSISHVINDDILFKNYSSKFIVIYNYINSAYFCNLPQRENMKKNSVSTSTYPDVFPNEVQNTASVYYDIFLNKVFTMLSFSKFEHIMNYTLENNINASLYSTIAHARELEWYIFVGKKKEEDSKENEEDSKKEVRGKQHSKIHEPWWKKYEYEEEDEDEKKEREFLEKYGKTRLRIAKKYGFLKKKTKKKKKKKKKRIGSYASRKIKFFVRIRTPIPSIYTMYYIMYNIFFYLFYYNLSVRYYGFNFYINWGVFIHLLFLRLLDFNKFIQEYEWDISVYRKKKHADDNLFYGFNTFKHLFKGVKRWINFRKQPIYVKNREYLFLIEKKMFNWFSKPNNSKGYIIDKIYGYDDLILRSSMKSNRKTFKLNVSSVSVIKKFFIKHQRFKGYGDNSTLYYLAELTDENVGYMTRGGFSYDDDFCYERIIMGDTLYHDRYLDEKKFFFFRYRTMKSFLESIIKPIEQLDTPGRYLKKSNYKMWYLVMENSINPIKREGVIEDKLQDTRDFFNPILDYRSFLTDVDMLDNYIHTRSSSGFLFYLYSKHKKNNMSLGSHRVSYNKNNNLYHSMLRLNLVDGFFDVSVPIQLYNLVLFSKHNYTNYISFDKYYNVYVYLYNNDLTYASHIALFRYEHKNYNNKFISKINKIFPFSFFIDELKSFVKEPINYMFILSVHYIKSINFLVKYHLSNTSLFRNKIILREDISIYKEIYLHSKLFYDGFYYNSSWYIYLLKNTIVECITYYYKTYYVWLFIYNCSKDVISTSKSTVDFYKWCLQYFYKFTGLNLNMLYSQVDFFKKIGFFDFFFKVHIGRIFIINNWLGYWFNFLNNKSICVDYDIISKYLFFQNIEDEVINIYFSEFDLYKFDHNSLKFNIISDARDTYNVLNKHINFDTLFSYNYLFLWYIIISYIQLDNIIFNSFLKSHSTLYFIIILIFNLINRIRIWYSMYRKYFKYFRMHYIKCGELNFCFLPFIHKSNILNLSFNLISRRTKLLKFNIFFSKIIRLNRGLRKIRINSSRKHIRRWLKVRLLLKKNLLRKLYINIFPIINNKLNSIRSKFHDFVKVIRLFSTFTYYNKLTYYNLSLLKVLINSSFNSVVLVNNGLENHAYISTNYFDMDYIEVNDSKIYSLGYDDYLSMFEHANPSIDEVDNLKSWFGDHYFVKFESRRYYSKFWYRFVPRDIVHIQRYRRFQQEVRRLIANRKRLRTGIIYRRLLLFKLVPGVFKEWHKLHVRRPYINEQFEDRVRFFYILKYKYNLSRKRIMTSLYNRFNSPYSLYKAYHLLYFRLDNILYKLSFIPSFHFIRNSWILYFWNISINNIYDSSRVQSSLIVGDMFFIKNGLHVISVNFRTLFHTENNIYLVYLLFLRLDNLGFDVDLGLPSEDLHIYFGRLYLFYWSRFFIDLSNCYLIDYKKNIKYFFYKMMSYGFWAHNFLKFRDFKRYMLITSIDNYVRWFHKSMCGFVYREPSVGFFYGLHYSSFYKKESGAYGGHLRFNCVFK